MYFAHAEAATDWSGIKGDVGEYAMMRTSLRTCWRTVGHDDLDLRLRRALAHGSFDTSSIFHRPGGGKHEVSSSSCHPKLSAVHAFSIPVRVVESLSRSSQNPLLAGPLASLTFFYLYRLLRYVLETALLP